MKINLSLKAEVQMLTSSIKELTELNTTLRDEHRALVSFCLMKNEERSLLGGKEATMRHIVDERHIVVGELFKSSKKLSNYCCAEKTSFYHEIK
jgi:ssRNA-specific RNase YbeY (16S rRNA maturation enzyme)